MSFRSPREERRQAEDQAKAAIEEQKKRETDIRAVAATPEGARLLAWLIHSGGIFSIDFQPNATNPFNQGRRHTAILLWKLLDQCLDNETFNKICRAKNAPYQLTNGDNDE